MVRILVRAVLTIIIILMTILLIRAFDTRQLPNLQVWHTTQLSNEFHRSRYTSDMTFEQYKDLEDRLFDELNTKVLSKTSSSEHNQFNRYNHSSLSSPDRFTQNWNRSFELVPEQMEGAVLLIHGLTDSPYSMKTLAELFYEANFYVLALRMPGHGTIPAGLTDVSWQDWIAVVEMGVRHVTQKRGSKHPFYMVGYSNGGALSLLYTLKSLDNDNLECPDRVFLFSPAIGITKYAAMARWLKMTSKVPYFEKSKWKSISPEYDPFKYNSFPLNAAEQSYKLSRQIHESLYDLHVKGILSKLPPVITFQSAVDSTVLASDVWHFYKKLSPNRHELIEFDINRNASLQNMMKKSPLKLINKLAVLEKSNYQLNIITNEKSDSKDVVIKTKEEGESVFNDTPLNMRWPNDVYSLSHLAVLFPIDDPLYGLDPSSAPCDHIQLGNIHMRGERNVLRVSEKDLMRLRCNPFWEYVKNRIEKVILEDK